MKTNEELARQCAELTHDELLGWIAGIRRESFKAGEEYALKWVIEECNRQTERLIQSNSTPPAPPTP